MTTEFTVDLDHLDEIVSRLAGLAGFVADNLDEIDNKIATLSSSGWESVAATAYHDAHREWMIGAREFTDGVREMSNAARKAHTGYSTAVEENLKMLRGG